jgi:PAS domain S-box-containing protein
MTERGVELPRNVDVTALGKTMLEAAEAARIGVAVAVFEPSGPRSVYLSEAVAEIVGWSTAELLQTNPLTHIAPEDLPRISERLSRRARGEAGQKSYELTIVRKDGRRVPIEVTASDAVVDGRRAVFAFVVDVSARKAAEESRLRAETRFRELIERAPEPIGIIRESHFVFANPAFVHALAYPSADELYAVALSDLVHADEAELVQAREKLIHRVDGPLPTVTYRARRYDGSAVLLETTSTAFEYEGHPAVLTIARDVTARRTLQTQLVQADRLAALGTMAAGMAHEINNPLAYMMLNLDWIARKLPEAASEPSSMQAIIEMLREARHGAERVAAIVRELRSFSRADGETKHYVDLGAVVQSAIKIAGHEIRHRTQVSTSFESVGPVLANEARLEQVVLNLLLNAAHAMPEARAATNELRVSVRPDALERAVLEVFDNGEGIAPEVLPRIFDPFFTTKPHGVGTGLGLSICHGIVASLGGQITVHSEPGEGTTFRVVLPTTDAEEVEDARTQEPTSEPPSSRGGPRARVLVVDDEVPIANTMRDLLSTQHDVTAATSAREALTLVRAGHDFDVIFCDLMMPGMSGIDLYELLRDERPELAKRIVFMTGGAFTSRAAEFLASVESRRVEKPFSLGLIEQIAREMAGAAGRR